MSESKSENITDTIRELEKKWQDLDRQTEDTKDKLFALREEKMRLMHELFTTREKYLLGVINALQTKDRDRRPEHDEKRSFSDS